MFCLLPKIILRRSTSCNVICGNLVIPLWKKRMMLWNAGWKVLDELSKKSAIHTSSGFPGCASISTRKCRSKRHVQITVYNWLSIIAWTTQPWRWSGSSAYTVPGAAECVSAYICTGNLWAWCSVASFADIILCRWMRNCSRWVCTAWCWTVR